LIFSCKPYLSASGSDPPVRAQSPEYFTSYPKFNALNDLFLKFYDNYLIIYTFNTLSYKMNRAKNKMRIYILAISLLFIYSIACKAQNSPAKNSYTFDVSPGIQKTDLKINEGDRVQLSASGTVVLRGVTGSVGPEGKDGFKNCRMDQVFEYGALLYKIGDDDWNIVDPEDTIIAERIGYLKFMINDNDPSNDSGKFIVKVTVNDSIQKVAKKIVPKKIHIAEPKKIPENTSPHLPATTLAGTLTLSELQKASSYNFNDAKSFLTSKQFRIDNESKDNMSKYSFNKDDVTASIVKDGKENQTTFETSSTDNYEQIKASLDKFGYTHRKAGKKVEGVSKYANSKYALSIVSLKLNNKTQYFFTIKKLKSRDEN
jgi:hypothetical protein